MLDAFREAVVAFRAVHRHWRRRRRRAVELGDSLATVAALDGMVSDDEARCLFDLARTARDGVIVEIGSYHGKSTVALALGSQMGADLPVYAIDPMMPWSGLRGRAFGPDDKAVLCRNLLLAGVTRQVWVVQLASLEAVAGWRKPIALLFLDGDHSYKAVRGDVEAWSAHLQPDGHLVLDDATDRDAGVARYLGELVASGQYVQVRTVGKMAVLARASR
jgi:predicted O-methyltransferase YrrM